MERRACSDLFRKEAGTAEPVRDIPVTWKAVEPLLEATVAPVELREADWRQPVLA
jgi:hypothetical protein